ncbi:toxic anion resistance protein [Halanaerobacter jeridensis]|uniref:Uncharacterized protein YaaN involved in tellurite resistance n=1 Tax=Halanaerobacter jeridensis TaxID=706427 RepID=A0A938XS93_9FIRM|nr:uncharacterized protein YaaN involved in tellurite resistance [Halanaerobacter jeridensis]
MEFSMEVMDKESVKEEIVEQVEPVSEEMTKLKELAAENASEIMELDLDSLEKRKTVINSVQEFGKDTLENSAQKNKLLKTSVGDLSKMGGEGGEVADSLLDLQEEIKDLDPSAVDFAKTGLLSKIFNPMRSYFNKYQQADEVINDIIVSLKKGKATLKNDNTTLEIEEVAMRDLTKKLRKEIELGTMMDEEISAQIETAQANNEDQDKIKFIKEEILFPLRQKIMDLQQMIVVNQQGIMSIEVIRRNNKELIRGVDRAINVTVSAMRTAAIVASALYNQKIVLKKIKLLNETTNDLISGTSKMLKEQGTEIHKQSMEENISVETLKTAFADAISAMDEISTYKQEALPKMKNTIDEFKELADKGEEQIQKIEEGDQISLS